MMRYRCESIKDVKQYSGIFLTAVIGEHLNTCFEFGKCSVCQHTAEGRPGALT